MNDGDDYFVDGQEAGKELLSQKFGASLSDISVCSAAQRAAILADDSVRFVDLSEWKVICQ